MWEIRARLPVPGGDGRDKRCYFTKKSAAQATIIL
jgi:hypothetical protein